MHAYESWFPRGSTLWNVSYKTTLTHQLPSLFLYKIRRQGLVRVDIQTRIYKLWFNIRSWLYMYYLFRFTSQGKHILYWTVTLVHLSHQMHVVYSCTLQNTCALALIVASFELSHSHVYSMILFFIFQGSEAKYYILTSDKDLK